MFYIKNRVFMAALMLIIFISSVNASRVMENLNRGIIAIRTDANNVYVGWRMLGTDPSDIEFNLYRNGTKVNSAPMTDSTNYVDNTTSNGTYTVRPIISGVEQSDSESAGVSTSHIISIPLNIPAGGTTPDAVDYTYVPNDCSTGDIDGDGEYEIILKWDPTNSKDNSQSGYTGNVYLDAYELNGTFLWRIDLGKNIRAGAHYTQFMVYDLDNDGDAEVACKTAPGTKDGTGSYLSQGPASYDDDSSDYRNGNGYILTGEEYLTVFNGANGAEITTVNYVPARGSVSSWGDNYGNRVDRFLACVAYLDNATPSLVMCRGYYTRAVLAAWDFDGSNLTQRWVFDSNDPGNGGYAGQGNHNLAVGDIDNDGFDEIVYGACAIDHDGTGLYTTGLGHGDAGHLSDLDPDRPGLEYFQPHEDTSAFGNYGAEFRVAGQDVQLWGYASGNDVGRGIAADIDSAHRGYEFWASNTDGVYNVDGTRISTSKPSINFRIYWDGDLQDEILDDTKMDKWNGNGTTRLYTIYNDNAASNNGTKANPGLVADLFGDWREEMVYRHWNNSELLVFTTTIPTNYRFYTFMHDSVYREAVAWQNVAYNQPPHPSFYLADGVSAQPTADIIYPNSPPTPDYSPTFTNTLTNTPTLTPIPVGYQVIQGEGACAFDGVFENSNAGYLGTGYANLDNATGTAITFYLDSTSSVSLNLKIRYANGSATNRNMEVFVNGSSQVASLDFNTTGAWTTWQDQNTNINLQAGYNTITLVSLNAEGAPNLDLFSWVSTQVSDAGCTITTATNTNTQVVTTVPSNTPTSTSTPGPAGSVEPFLCSAPGWASENGGTIGGGSAAAVTVTTLSQLQTEASSSGSKVIIVSGTVGSSVADRVLVGSDKTIIGLPGAALIGGFDVKDCSNVIVRNMSIQGPGAVDVDGVDCITVQNATNVWLDHLDIQDGQDGNLDIVNGSNYVTVTFCKFHYTGASVNHQFCNLIGNSDTKTTDRGKLKVTFMHNWWADNVHERMPRLRFGQVHMSNNLFTSAGNNYCARAGFEADLFVEYNVFKNVNDPVDLYNGDYTAVTMENNDFINVSGNTSGNGTAFTPPYALATIPVTEVESFVSAYAGVRNDFSFCPSSGTLTPTHTSIPTGTPSSTSSVSDTETPTETETFTHSVTSTFTPADTETETFTYTETDTPVYTETGTFTETHTETETLVPTESETPTITETAPPGSTYTYTPTDTNTPVDTATESPSETATNTGTETFTHSVTSTFTLENTFTESETPTITDTVPAGSTDTYTPTNTSIPTGTPSSTSSVSNTETPTQTYTFTATYTQTFTHTYTMTATSTPTLSINITLASPSTINVGIDTDLYVYFDNNRAVTSIDAQLQDFFGTPLQTVTLPSSAFSAGSNNIIIPLNDAANGFDLAALASNSYRLVLIATNVVDTVASPMSLLTINGAPTVTETETLPAVNTSTETPTPTYTHTYTETPVLTNTETQTPNPSVTPTPTQEDTLEITELLPYPNPYNSGMRIPIRFGCRVSQKDVDTLSIRIYTSAYRLIKEAVFEQSAVVQVISRKYIEYSAGDLSNLANGTYYYVIIAEKSGEVVRSKVDKFIILK